MLFRINVNKELLGYIIYTEMYIYNIHIHLYKYEYMHFRESIRFVLEPGILHEFFILSCYLASMQLCFT